MILLPNPVKIYPFFRIKKNDFPEIEKQYSNNSIKTPESKASIYLKYTKIIRLILIHMNIISKSTWHLFY